ncbi:MAG: NAD-dependent epimerase/dehydratase family protein [Bryobacteraceae bacterium]|nr:NAD-dependent epimerase/dehydratase family protein [Bryobacteraceae bacterium]
MHVLVIGGTLFIGRNLVPALLKAGHDVTIVHRKPGHDLGRKVHEIIADRNDAEAFRAAMDGHRFEIVFDNVYDWQRGTTSAQVEATARTLSDRLVRYVFMSSVAAYGDGLNHHEGDALAPDNHADAYVRNKAMSERALFRMHQRNGFPVVTMRPPFIYGPGNPYYREAFFWDRLRDNRPVILPGDGRRLMQFIHVTDLVGACMKAIEEPSVSGHAFNIANPRPVTQYEVVQALAAVAGKTPNFVRIPRQKIFQMGGHPMGPLLYFGVYFDMPPITQVVTKAQRLLKFKGIDFIEGLRETYRWYLRHHEKNTSNYEFEDKLIANAPAQLPEI